MKKLCSCKICSCENLSLPFIAFLQAVGLVVYCGLVGLIFWKGNQWFTPPGYLGPVMVLTLLVVSALICALIAGGYPFLLFWEKKETRVALRLVGYTVAWLIFFFLLILLLLVASNV